MQKRPNILITNDDGIHAPGIWHLWNSLKEWANLTIVAPIAEQSAVGLGITIRHPLILKQMEWPEKASAWSVNGTPADCIKLGLNVVFNKTQPDLIVSGINRGTNAGRNVLYSGTVGGTIEGVMHGIPGIAFSCQDFENPNYKRTEQYIPTVIKHVLDHPLPKGTLLNVNFPDTLLDVKGFKMTRQGQEFWAENPDERTHPAEGHSYYWLGARLAESDHEDDETDVSWLKKGYITAVPVHIGELTDHKHLHSHKDRFEDLFSHHNIL